MGEIHYLTAGAEPQQGNAAPASGPPPAGAPAGAEYLLGAAHGDLTAGRVVTDTSSVEWDLGTAGQAKAQIPATAALAVASLTVAGVPVTGGGLGDGDKGDVTVSGSGATWTIDNDAVTNAKLRDSAARSVIGRSASSVGDPADIAPGAAGGGVLSSDGSDLGWTLTSTADRVLITVGAGVPTWATVTTASLTDAAVTFAKMQNLTTDRLIGRDTGATGPPEEITVGGGLEFTGSGGIQRSALTGDVTASAGSNTTTVANKVLKSEQTSDQATSSTSAVDTSISVAVESGRYAVKAYLILSTDAVGNGIRTGFNGPTLTRLHLRSIKQDGTNSELALRQVTAYDTALPAVASEPFTTDLTWLYEGLLEVSASGNFVVRLWAEVNTSSVNIKAGSWMQIQKLN